jgi:hypothetical protein
MIADLKGSLRTRTTQCPRSYLKTWNMRKMKEKVAIIDQKRVAVGLHKGGTSVCAAVYADPHEGGLRWSLTLRDTC